MVTFQDWREATAADVKPLFEAEAERWLRTLGWDYAPSHYALEEARSAGRLPGIVAWGKDGRAFGWSYYLLHGTRLQIGALVADDAAVVQGLLQAVLRSREAREAEGISCFLYPAIPHVEHVLRRARLMVARHAYLQRTLSPGGGLVGSCRVSLDDYAPTTWSIGRLAELAELLAVAYESMPEARCFAPTGCSSEWLSYVGQIVHSPACGRFDAELTGLLLDHEGRMSAALVATRLAEQTAHIAQVVVAAGHRRKGLAAHLVRQVCANAQAGGCDRVTLIVAETNEPARRLYERLGFEQVAGFLFGYR